MEIKILDNNPYGQPCYATDGSGALDLRACIDKPIDIPGGCTELIGAGIAIHIDNPDMGALVIPRSGMGYKRGLVLGNGTGLIDSDYQGQVHVPLLNRGCSSATIRPGDKIAQMFFIPLLHPVFEVVEEFSESTSRGEGGFGSTGR